MALRDTFEGVLDKARGIFQRKEKSMDAFGGGDDLYEGDDTAETDVDDEADVDTDVDADDDAEGRKSALATKIAYGVSGVMLLGLVGVIAALFLTGDKTVAPSGGSLAGLQLEEEATEGTAERRPWLTSTQGGQRRLGMTEDTKPTETKAAPAPNAAAKPAPLPAKEEAKPAATTPATPPVTAAAPAQAPATANVAEAQKPATPTATPPADAKAPAVAAAPDAKPAPAQVAAAVPAAPAQPAEAKPGALPTPDLDEEPVDEETKVAGMPSLMAPAPSVPGAPRRAETDNGSGAMAGGKPRINDPPLPPVDRASVGAPPPRFAAISNIKFDTTAAANTPKIAIIVEGLGLNKASTEAALAKLPPTVTLAFSPYARDLKQLMDRAKRKGHEVLIEVPMESKAFPADDPGPLGLLTSLDAKENGDRLDTILKEATGAVGVYDSTGSKFRESQVHIGEVKTKLKASNLFYVQGRPGVRVGDIAIPNATTDVVIDERPFRAAVDARFDFAERLAKFQGNAVAVMSARPISFERLALWVEQLPKKGVTLAPVSQVLVQ
jgi:uncharacterized protein